MVAPSPTGELRFRVLKPVVLAIGAAVFVALLVSMSFFFEKTVVDCARAKNAERECTITETPLLGATDVRHIAAGKIRRATLGASISKRSGGNPGQVDKQLVLTMKDGTVIYVDDVGLAFIDPVLAESDVESLDRFVTDTSEKRAHAATGGFLTASLILGVLTSLIAGLAFVWGKDEIALSVEDGLLTISGPDGSSTHPLAGYRAAVVDEAYRSLRINYEDGRSVQAARIGANVQKLADIARQTHALIVGSRTAG